MSDPQGGRRYTDGTQDHLETLLLDSLRGFCRLALAPMLRQAVREEVQREIASRTVADRREWLTQPAAAQVAGCSVSTIRNWQGEGKLSKGERGRVNAAELRALLAGRKATSGGDVLDLKAAKIAASLKGGN